MQWVVGHRAGWSRVNLTFRVVAAGLRPEYSRTVRPAVAWRAAESNMQSSGSTKNEIVPLTGVRGAAALWVLFYHFGEELSVLLPSFGKLAPIYQYGFIGVDLFFVLSGFIITFVHATEIDERRIDKRSYIVKRFARVYPNHLLTMGALAVLVVGAGMLGKPVEGNYGLGTFVGHLALLHGSPLVSAEAWNYPSWSISAEFFGYLAVFPLTIVLFRSESIRRNGLWASLGLCLLFGVGWVCGWWGEWRNIARIACEFAAGALLFHGLCAVSKFGSIMGRLLLPVGIVFAVLMLAFSKQGTQSAVIIGLIGCCPLVIVGLASREGMVAKVFSTRFSRWLGLISYALYMSHALVEKVLKVLLPVGQFATAPLALRMCVFAIHVAAPIVVAAVIYRFWEEPMRRSIQRWFRKR